MTTTELQDRLADVQAERERRKIGAGERYHELIASTTDGIETDPAVAAEILHDAERTVEQLESDCELLTKRRKWAETIQNAESAPATIQKGEQEIGKLRSELATIVRDFNQRIAQQQLVVAGATDSMTAALTAKRQLTESAWQFIVDQENEFRKELQYLGQNRTLAEIELKRLRQQADHQEKMSRPQPPESRRHVTTRDQALYGKYAAANRKRIADTEKTLGDQQKVIDALLAQIAELQELRLIP